MARQQAEGWRTPVDSRTRFARALRSVVAFSAVALSLLALAGCPKPPGGVFSGRVTDQSAQPVADALVQIAGKETHTDTNGDFKLEVPGAQRYILNISHLDFAELSYISRTPLSGQTWRLVRAQIFTVDPKAPITLKEERPELKLRNMKGAVVSLAANSLEDPQGSPPAGIVRAAIASLDVANGEGPGDWAVRSDDGTQDGFLISYGAVFIQFTDAAGAVRYRLRSGATVKVSLPVIPSMARYAPRTPQQRFWYYDTSSGYWKHTGTANLDAQSGAYVGTADHLSTINTDIAKFSDAACLKITLDPSIAVGNKLRIRYHSAGTPFGQTPTFVMNDTVNAAYRLPANTNVLLALLNPADEEFGNAVVEDPVGTPLVNMVVNTGPALPPGADLWPPPPFNTCKPILLRLSTPEVEVRINELPADASPKDNPSDDYVTWAPTFARARLTSTMPSAVNVVLTNDVPGRIPGGGDVLFAAHADPWPVNTTAAADTLALSLPADGSWMPFVIAGKFLTPSTNDKDAIIEVRMGSAAGAIIGRKALMVRIRKNANSMQPSERSRFLFAIRAFRNKLGTNFVQFQEMHRLATTAGDEAHQQPAFLPWHRVMLLDVERELQKIDPSVTLPYWNWDAAAPNVFSEHFIGAGNVGSSSFVDEPIFAPTNPLNGWNTDLPFSGGELRRTTDNHTVAPIGGAFKPLDHPVDPSLVDRADYGPRSVSTSFSREVENLSHDPSHGWPCAGGHLTMPVRSAADPLFYLLHSQIEHQWAYWQWQNNRLGTPSGGALTFPVPGHYDNNGNWNDPGVVTWQKGSFLDDGQWPWDGTSGGPAFTREQRPVNQAPAPGTNIPLSNPLIPMTPFPASLQRNLWPASPAIPRPRDVIDYLGRFRPQDGLGFAYDDTPYQ